MLKRLVFQSGFYALVGVVSKLSGVVLLALYGNPDVLPLADFGYLGGLDAAKTLGLLLAGAGLPLGVIRFATSPDLDASERASVPATAYAIAGSLGLIVGATLAAGAPLVAAGLLGDASLAPAVRWMALYVALRTLADVPYTQLRADERAGHYAFAGALEALLTVAGVAYFLLVARAGLVGVMQGYVVSAGAMALGLTAVVFRGRPWRIAGNLVRPLLAFGVPLVVSGLAARFLNIGDRFFILRLLTPEANAVYEWAARFGGIVNVFLVQSFQMAFTVLGLRALDATGDAALHRRAFRHFAALAGAATLALGLFLPDASRLLTRQAAFIGADGLALLIGGGFAFYGLYVVVVNVLYAAGQTRLVAMGVLAAAIANAAMNAALLPVLGVAGAAVATLVAYAGLAMWTASRAERIVHAGYPWRAVVAVAVAVGTLWGAGTVTADWPLAGRLAARTVLLVAYLPLLYVAGVYRREDLDVLQRIRRDRRRDGSGSTDGSTHAPDGDPAGDGSR